MINTTDIIVILGNNEGVENNNKLMKREKKRSLHIMIYPSILDKLNAIASLENKSLSETIAKLIENHDSSTMP